MDRRKIALFLLIVPLFVTCSACKREKAPASLENISEACSQWCVSAYKSVESRETCSDTCQTFVERFRSCMDRESSCRKARKCAAEAMKKECASRDEDREICTLGAEYAYGISLDYCIDRAEKL